MGDQHKKTGAIKSYGANSRTIFTGWSTGDVVLPRGGFFPAQNIHGLPDQIGDNPSPLWRTRDRRGPVGGSLKAAKKLRGVKGRWG